MIAWFGVASAALWILGLAILLAAVSIARSFDGTLRATRQVLSEPGFRAAMIAGMILFALGMALSAGSWWERIGWFVVVALTTWEGAAAWQSFKKR